MKNITRSFTSIGLLLLTTVSFGQLHSKARIVPQADYSFTDIKKHGLIKSAKDTVMTLPYNSVDSMQFVAIPITPVSIPNTARNGWNFGINVIVKGSKLDTVGVFYFSQYTSCSNSDNTNAHTTVGEYISPEVPNVNSFFTGLYWYNDAKNYGDDSALTWPTTTGIKPGFCLNSGGYQYYNQYVASCTDTGYFPVQDLGIYTSITYNSGLNALIDYVNGDYVISSTQLATWVPPLYMNSNYVLSDTTYSPSVSFGANANLPTNATVTFDTLWDYYTQNFISPITAGSVAVDTLWAEMAYFNSSHMPDTVIFQVCSVTPSGFPHRAIGKGHQASVIYGADTLILKPGGPLSSPVISRVDFSVGQNYPNPFANTSQIKYTLLKSSDVDFSISDMTGRILITNVYSNASPGEHLISLNANLLSPGLYFYTFNVEGMKVTKSMIITKD